MMIMNVTIIMPGMIEDQNAVWMIDGVPRHDIELTDSDTSLIIAIFSFAQLVFSPVNGSVKNFLGTKNAILFGFVLLTITSIGLGAVKRIKNPYIFKYTALAMRFFQGMGFTLSSITAYSVVTSVFSSEMMKYIAYIEICIGIGLGLGPLLCSLFYSLLGYE